MSNLWRFFLPDSPTGLLPVLSPALDNSFVNDYHWPPISPHMQPSTPSGLEPLAATLDAPGLVQESLLLCPPVASPALFSLPSPALIPHLSPQLSQSPSSPSGCASNVVVDDGTYEEYSWPPVSSHLGPSTPSVSEPLAALLQSYDWPPLSPHFQPSPSGLRRLAASPDAPGLDLQPLPSLSSVASPVHDPLSSLDSTTRLPPQVSQPPSSLPDRPSNVGVHCLPAWALSRHIVYNPFPVPLPPSTAPPSAVQLALSFTDLGRFRTYLSNLPVKNSEAEKIHERAYRTLWHRKKVKRRREEERTLLAYHEQLVKPLVKRAPDSCINDLRQWNQLYSVSDCDNYKDFFVLFEHFRHFDKRLRGRGAHWETSPWHKVFSICNVHETPDADMQLQSALIQYNCGFATFRVISTSQELVPLTKAIRNAIVDSMRWGDVWKGDEITVGSGSWVVVWETLPSSDGLRPVEPGPCTYGLNQPMTNPMHCHLRPCSPRRLQRLLHRPSARGHHLTTCLFSKAPWTLGEGSE